jgi:endonuclease/exonuclease/phosphatase family metal-dependent hydrolase
MNARRLHSALVLFMLALAGCPGDDAKDDADGGGAESGEFTVLSYNVAGLPQEFSNENPTEHLPLISPLLEDYDIVMTQEDFDWWVPALDTFDFVHYHERLRKDVTHKYQTERHPGPDAVGLDLDMHPAPSVGDGLGFLSRIPFDDVVRVPWTRCFGGAASDGGAGDCLAMKGFMVARFELPSGDEVDIYTLHVEAGGTELDQELQDEGMLKLADFVADHSAGRAIILGGDTNLHTDGTHADSSGDLDGKIWSRFLKATKLIDTCTELDCDEPGSIDKIAYRNSDTVTLEPLTHRFETDKFIGEEGEDLSDHPPLAVTFRWTMRN